MKPSFPTYYAYMISRDQIAEFSRRLAACIPADFIRDKGTPVQVSIEGSYQCGKKIIPDLMRDELLGDDLQDTDKGNAPYDEYATGEYQGEHMEVSYIDMAWGREVFSFYDPDQLASHYSRSDQSVLDTHLENRSKMGVAFIHNANSQMAGTNIQTNPDIEIWVEKDDYLQNMRFCAGGPRCYSLGEKLEKHFSKAAISEGWGRYVEIGLPNAELAENKAVQATLQEFRFSLKR